MKQEDLLKTLNKQDLKKLSRSDLIELLLGEQDIRLQLENQNEKLEEERLLLGQKYVIIKSKIFDRSSEKSPHKPINNSGNKKDKKKRTNFSKLPSKRYPNLDIEEKDVELEILPTCQCCSSQMKNAGMTENSEYVTVIPKKYLIV